MSIEPAEIGKNEFEFVLPKTKRKITFSLANSEDNREISTTVQKLKSATNSTKETNISTRFKRLILSIDGNYDKTKVSEFIDRRMMPIADSIALRKYMDEISPDIITKQDFICKFCGNEGEVNIPIGFDFFWRG